MEVALLTFSKSTKASLEYAETNLLEVWELAKYLGQLFWLYPEQLYISL